MILRKFPLRTWPMCLLAAHPPRARLHPLSHTSIHRRFRPHLRPNLCITLSNMPALNQLLNSNCRTMRSPTPAPRVLKESALRHIIPTTQRRTNLPVLRVLGLQLSSARPTPHSTARALRRRSHMDIQRRLPHPLRPEGRTILMEAAHPPRIQVLSRISILDPLRRKPVRLP